MWLPPFNFNYIFNLIIYNNTAIVNAYIKNKSAIKSAILFVSLYKSSWT